MASVKESRGTFLKDVLVIDVEGSTPTPTGSELVNVAVQKSMDSGFPVIEMSAEEGLVTLVLPVFRSNRIVSLAAFVAWASEEAIGVFEIWQPIGEYDELNLTGGYFGSLERFQNVSSFVRFEKGSGLPGQVWRNLSHVVHDNLPRHTGFLRAAGASAKSLQVAVGMPVLSDQFMATALLISSDLAPISRAFEVWRYADDSFLLETKAYQNLPTTLRLEEGASVATTGSLPGLALETGVVRVTDAPKVLGNGRGNESFTGKGIAVPFFEGERLTNVLTLVL
ncbi:MAG: GAF domain-containing protein [Planctomycetota bacterium]